MVRRGHAELVWSLPLRTFPRRSAVPIVRSVDHLRGALAGNLRRYRALRGLSSSEVASRSGVARATLSALEAGRGNPTLDTLSALADVLDLPVSTLVANESASTMAVIRAPAADAPEPDRIRLLRRFAAGPCVIDMYGGVVRRDECWLSEAYGASVYFHLLVGSGRAQIRMIQAFSNLGEVAVQAGDYAVFAASAQYEIRALDGDLWASLVVHYPVTIERRPVLNGQGASILEAEHGS